MSRRGTVLTVVAGLAAILAALTLAFLVRTRSAAEETDAFAREAQARVMLVAACQYLQEASRIGWDASPAHRETFGWLDARDGRIGPKFAAGADDDDRWPIGAARRFPMHVLRRPPYALRLTAVYNPMSQDPAAADFAMPYLRDPDPQPAVDNGWPGAVDATGFAAWRDGDPRPRATSTGLAWFRLHRLSAARFVVTCGAGATQGFRDWDEVVAAGATEVFAGDEARFAEARDHEARLWYVVEWSAAVLAPEYQNIMDSLNRLSGRNRWTPQDDYQQWPLNATHTRQPDLPAASETPIRSQMQARNLGGTIRWVQRLAAAPERW